MQHPDFTSQLARERRDRYRSDAGWNRLTRPDRNDDAGCRVRDRDETEPT